LVESFTRVIAAALNAGNATIVLATKQHRGSLLQRLKEEGLDVDGAIQQGTYTSLDAADMLSTIMVNGVPDRVRFFAGLSDLIEPAAKATKKKNPRIAVCGECVGVLCTLGNAGAAIQLEKIGNDLIHTRNADILCAYPLSGFRSEKDDSAFSRICAEHSAVSLL
jgi:hypothetical protein